MENQNDANFIAFKEDVHAIELPKKFTFPFDYSPHPLAIAASHQLQQYLETQTDWHHDFGIENSNDPTVMGKMFGVLIVKNPKGQLGFLQSFSGIIGKQTRLPLFVPPIFDRLQPGFSYKEKEKEIMAINKELLEIQANKEYLETKNEFQIWESQNKELLKNAKTQLKHAKKLRQKERKLAIDQLSETAYQQLHEKHQVESRKTDFEYKTLASQYQTELAERKDKLNFYTNEIERLKSLRKKKSAEAQQLIFDHYQFKNGLNKITGITNIFKDSPNQTPPSGAGDCAAPKLLQYAFDNNYTPIALAEFWWGKSPKLEVRQHKKYYPACKAKCHPILSFMLQGIEMDPNPVMSYNPDKLIIETLYEDDYLLAINKPSHLLSVPGKELKDSVQNRMKEKYPDATGPMVVHRLDMGTSGIMVIAKNLKTYHHLQEQFVKRTIKKQYTALLDGTPNNDSSTIDLPLRVDLNNRPHQVVCFEHGKPALTRWEILEQNLEQTLVRFYPHTGRTHQLRVHASHPKGLNTPIYGDELYGERKDRLHLHASQLEFIHPETNKKTVITSPTPFQL